jgi:hypothetical protein
VFPKGLARKNRICEMNRGVSLYFDFFPLTLDSEAALHGGRSIPEGSREEK